MVGIGAIYPIVRDNQDQFGALLDTYPDELLAIMGVGAEESLFDPVGFMRAEAFGWIVPLVLPSTGPSRGTGGSREEEAGTIDLVMATPLSRFGLVLQKWLALVLTELVLGLALFVSLALDNVLFGLDIPLANSAAGCFMAVLLGVFFGSLALAVGAGTGLRGLSVGWSPWWRQEVICSTRWRAGRGPGYSAATVTLLLLRRFQPATSRS